MPVYSSPEDLLRKTPGFAKKIFEDRLDGYFEGGYRYFETHFGGKNPYLAQIREHLSFIGGVIAKNDLEALRREPVRIDAATLRGLLGIKEGERRASPLRLSRRTRRPRARPAEYIPV